MELVGVSNVLIHATPQGQNAIRCVMKILIPVVRAVKILGMGLAALLVPNPSAKRIVPVLMRVFQPVLALGPVTRIAQQPVGMKIVELKGPMIPQAPIVAVLTVGQQMLMVNVPFPQRIVVLIPKIRMILFASAVMLTRSHVVVKRATHGSVVP